VARELVALVSADDLVAAVRVHADRVHDLLRRSGCGPAESVEVSESYALALIDALVNAPDTVGDMAGWWFARALELGRRLGGGIESSEVDDASSASVLSGTTGEAQVRAALAGLGRDERTAVLLRDGYDLPPQAVAVALGTGPERAGELVGAGRLNLVSAYDDRQVPSLAGHSGRTPADLGTLAGLADGTLPAPQTVPQRRHLSSCSACEDVVEWMAKGRRLAAGLPIVAMPDEAREAMLERVAVRAAAVLPTVDEVLDAVEEEHDIRPAVSPVVVVLAIVMALVLGVALAALTSSGRGGGADALVPTEPTLVPETPSFSVSITPTKRSASPRTSRSSTPTAPASTASVQPSSAAPTTTAPPPEVPGTITLSPASGPRGTDITVKGRDWTPGAQVIVEYRATLGSSSTTAIVGQNGRFTAVVTANGTLPGSYPVDADGGGERATATFQQTS
jgi:hypothetical protein